MKQYLLWFGQSLIAPFKVSCINNLFPKVVLLGGGRTFKGQGLVGGH